jgi:drug/metabolite transporter (DMT)-like permease
MKLRFSLYPLAAVMIWSGNNIVTKMAAEAIAPSAIAFYRWLLALLLLTPFVGLAVWRNRRQIRPHLGKIAVLGLLGMVLYQSLAYFAAETTSATNIGMIASLMPLLTLGLNSLIARDPVTLGTLSGGLLSLSGLVILIGQGHPAALLTHGMAAGDGLMLVATVGYALYGVMLRKWAIPLPIWQLLYMQIVFAVLMLLPGFLLTPQAAITAANLPLILYAALGASIVAVFLWMRGVDALGATRASIFMNLMPVVTVLIAMPMLDEKLHAYHVVGGGIVLVGVLLAQFVTRPFGMRRNLA